MTNDPHIIIDHPEWAGRNCTLICGPPGAGKTTLALQLHSRTLDLADFPTGTPRERMRSFGRQAWRAGRNPNPDLAVVQGAPLLERRLHLADQCHPARTIILLTDADTCHQRVTARNRQGADGRGVSGQHAAIDYWWRQWQSERSQSVVTTTEW